MLTAATLVLDQILIGLLRGNLQLLRNAVFSLLKLVALVGVGVWAGSALHSAAWLGVGIFATWVGGSGLSLVLLGTVVAARGTSLLHRPQFAMLTRLRSSMLSHHGLNLALQIPSFIMPILVTALLSAELNASFYVAWMIAGLLSVFPTHLTMVLYAVGSKEPALMAEKTRMTLRLSYGMGIAACVFLWVGAPFILRFFGEAYAAQADWCLRLLGLGIFGLIIKDHYVAIRRVQNRINEAILILFITGIIEIVCAAVGAVMGGLIGLAIGWLVAVALQALVMLPFVVRTIVPHHTPEYLPTAEAESRGSS
jgi:O-antigen/teichoic acid export membrane protein